MEQKSFVNVNNKARRKKIVFNLDPHKKNYIKKINHNEMRNDILHQLSFKNGQIKARQEIYELERVV